MSRTPLDTLINETRNIAAQLKEGHALTTQLEQQLEQRRAAMSRLGERKRLLQDILKSYSEDSAHDILLAKLEAE